MSVGVGDNTVGPWAREKLAALGQYLDFYTKVLKNQAWVKGTVYVDAFAGPGRSRVRRPSDAMKTLDLLVPLASAEARDVEDYIRGSPRVALDIANPFGHYVFIERGPRRVAELEALRGEYADSRSIEIRHGTAGQELDGLLDGILGRPGYMAVAFLDPFGMQMRWPTIEGLAATRRVEVIINFPLDMAIRRMFPNDGDFPPGWIAALDVSFGSHDWYDQVYMTHTDMLGSKVAKRADYEKRLLRWYRARLKTAFGLVSTARLIRNTRGVPLYHLIWAGKHPKGQQGADYILGKGESVR